MPILDVEIVGNIEQQGIAQTIADAAGRVLKTGPGRTWVKVRFLNSNNYAENGEGSTNLKPVFVSVLLGGCDDLNQKEEIAQRLAKTFSEVLGRPAENIHVLFEPNALGRIAFGGSLRTD